MLQPFSKASRSPFPFCSSCPAVVTARSTFQVAITRGPDVLVSAFEVVADSGFLVSVFAQLDKLVPTVIPIPVNEAFFIKFLRFMMRFVFLSFCIQRIKYRHNKL